jgi:hypothetical protein
MRSQPIPKFPNKYPTYCPKKLLKTCEIVQECSFLNNVSLKKQTNNYLFIILNVQKKSDAINK